MKTQRCNQQRQHGGEKNYTGKYTQEESGSKVHTDPQKQEMTAARGGSREETDTIRSLTEGEEEEEEEEEGW